MKHLLINFQLILMLILMSSMSFCSLQLNAQPPVPGELIWYTFQGGLEADEGHGLAMDDAGNFYVVGRGTEDWDMTGQAPVSPVYTHNPSDKADRPFDVFVAKFSPEGVLTWYTFLGNYSSNDDGLDIAVDSDGEVFVVGKTANWYQPTTISWSEENRAFLAKLDPDGNLLWMNKMGTRASSNDVATAVDLDASGNVYITGHNNLKWTYPNPAGDPFEPLNDFIPAYGGNAFAASFDNNGNYLWHTFFGPGGASAADLVVKGNSIYLTGTAGGRLTIPGLSPAIDHAHGEVNDFHYYDGFALKLNTSGTFLWYTFLGVDFSQPIYSGQLTWANALDADDAGNVYITGSSWRGFPNSLSVINPCPGLGSDCFIAKLNSNDNSTSCMEWSTFHAYNQNDRGEDIKVDILGNIFVGANGLSSSNVLMMLDNSGNLQWLRGLWDYPGTGQLKSIAWDETGSLYFAGTSGTPWNVTLGGTVIHEHTLEWYNDAFLAKMHTGVIYNHPPVFTMDHNPVYVDRGDMAENSGTVSDPEGNPLSVNSWPLQLIYDGSGNWTWSMPTSGLPLGPYPVTLIAHDGTIEALDYFEVFIKDDEQRIGDGLEWLAGRQDDGGGEDDGSWNGQFDCFVKNDGQITITGFALSKFCSHSYESGMNPLDPSYLYHDNIWNGFDYLFSRAQTAGPGSGIYFEDPHPFGLNYSTAAVMMAIGSSRLPSYIINYPGNPVVHELTFQQLMQELVNYLVGSQQPDGSWDGDNIVSGNVAFGLLYGEAFGIEVPSSLKDKLSLWIDETQDDISQGGMQFPGGEPNMFHTAQIIVEMALVGDNIADNRVQNAVNYLADHWCHPEWDLMWDDQYVELFYTIMKAFKLFEIETITTCDGEIDWFTDLVNRTYRIPQHPEEGYWWCAWGVSTDLATCLALLTMEGDIPVPPVDNQPPMITCPDDITIYTTVGCTSDEDIGMATAIDDNDPNPVITNNALEYFPLGETQVTWTAIDNEGLFETCTQTVTVVDNNPPIIYIDQAEMDIEIWPPNHKYQTFHLDDLIESVEDNCAELDVSDVIIIYVTSDELEDAEGEGDGNTLNDIIISEDCKSIDLRKERQGGGNGRVYTIHFELDDRNGNIGTALCQVQVPHDNGSVAIDDGPVYDIVSNCSDRAITLYDRRNGADKDFVVLVYPNPLDSKTTLEYELKQPKEVILTIYNQMGKQVYQLKETQSLGIQQLTWYAENFPDGIYYYRLKAGNLVSNGKLIKLR